MSDPRIEHYRYVFNQRGCCIKPQQKVKDRVARKGCPHREKCYKGKYENRKVGFSKTMARKKAEATELINTEEEIRLRINRSIQVEGAFGVLKQDRDFRRFLTRGKQKTETQFFLLAFAFNIKQKESGKLHPPVCCALLHLQFSIIHSRLKAAVKSFDLRQPLNQWHWL